MNTNNIERQTATHRATLPFGLVPGDKALLAHAHPDDEAALTGGVTALLADAGVEVHSVIASDGKGSTLGDPGFVRGGWRRLEANKSLQILGVPVERQHYLGLHDGQLSRQSVQQQMSRGIARIVFEQGITTIITAGEAGWDGHSDHKAVHRSAALGGSTASKATATEIAIWGLSDPVDADEAVGVDGHRKFTALIQHVSQIGLHTVPDTGKPLPRITGHEQYTPLMHRESYQRVRHLPPVNRSREVGQLLLAAQTHPAFA